MQGESLGERKIEKQQGMEGRGKEGRKNGRRKDKRKEGTREDGGFQIRRRTRGTQLADERDGADRVTLTGGCRRPAQSLAQRIALGALLLFALVVNNAYSGQLLGLLANPPRHQDPARLADAARSLRSVYMTNDLKAAVSDANKDGSLNELLLKMRPKTFGINVKKLENMTQYGDEGIFDNTDDFKMYAYLVELTDHGQTELTQVSECFFRPGYQGFLVRRNSSAFDVLSTFALRIVQAGMYDHWKVKQRHHMDADGVTVPAGVMWRRPKPLSLSTLAGPFKLLAIVWVIAALLCGTEVILRMLQMKKRFWGWKNVDQRSKKVQWNNARLVW
ncbi:Protein of unknown function [Gryllus bimaculatus]|nr:Protein of unknown function [Gryllus bimaculatus]